MNVVVALPVAREFHEAKEFYEIERTGLGRSFSVEIKKAVKRIEQYPEAFPAVNGKFRKCTGISFPIK